MLVIPRQIDIAVADFADQISHDLLLELTSKHVVPKAAVATLLLDAQPYGCSTACARCNLERGNHFLC